MRVRRRTDDDVRFMGDSSGFVLLCGLVVILEWFVYFAITELFDGVRRR